MFSVHSAIGKVLFVKVSYRIVELGLYYKIYIVCLNRIDENAEMKKDGQCMRIVRLGISNGNNQVKITS